MEHVFGRDEPFGIGIEEELLLVDATTLGLTHNSVEILERMEVQEGSAHPEFYAGLIEFASPVCRDAAEATQTLARLRAAMRAAGGTAIGAGLHPAAAFGDAPNVPKERYVWVDDHLAAVTHRTPEAALHVHVGMPDPETAIVAFNGLREHLPVLQALAANSPYWYGRDSGHASVRASHNRAYPRFEIPRAFRDFEDYATTLEAIVVAGDHPSPTLNWWDIRPRPQLGTVEVRTMDSQSSMARATALGTLVHALARHEVENARTSHVTREVLVEGCHRASRYGLQATVWDGDALRPIDELIRVTVDIARPHARELGNDAPLEEIERIRQEGTGADRQRAAHARGGMRAVLELLAEETASA